MAVRKLGRAKPGKMKSYPSFASWKRDQSRSNQKLIESLERLVRNTAPEFTKDVKWGQGCWLLDGEPKAYIHAEPDYVQFGFYQGAQLDDPQRLLAGAGKFVRHVKVFDSRTVPRRALVELIQQVRRAR